MAKKQRNVGALFRGRTAVEAVAMANGADEDVVVEAKERRNGKARGPAPRAEQYESALYRVLPEQAAALRRIAGERVAPLIAKGAKGARPDMSVLVREALADWLRKQK